MYQRFQPKILPFIIKNIRTSMFFFHPDLLEYGIGTYLEDLTSHKDLIIFFFSKQFLNIFLLSSGKYWAQNFDVLKDII